jgi:hypothetical protein
VQWYYYDVGGSDPSSLSYQQWQRMLEFGEFIKFVQPSDKESMRVDYYQEIGIDFPFLASFEPDMA